MENSNEFDELPVIHQTTKLCPLYIFLMKPIFNLSKSFYVGLIHKSKLFPAKVLHHMVIKFPLDILKHAYKTSSMFIIFSILNYLTQLYILIKCV